jgi:hypothetical protein
MSQKIEPELVEKAPLVSILSPHHRQVLPIPFNQESSFGDSLKHFFDSIAHSVDGKVPEDEPAGGADFKHWTIS